MREREREVGEISERVRERIVSECIILCKCGQRKKFYRTRKANILLNQQSYFVIFSLHAYCV